MIPSILFLKKSPSKTFRIKISKGLKFMSYKKSL